jgi:aminoglycoside phosphotransferase (APT) family kinase protein
VTGITKVIRLDEHRVLKRGVHDRQETDTMRFIAANTTIPVPKVHDIKFDRENSASWIVMDYAPGEMLDKAWMKLTPSQRLSTCRQLAGYLAQLQALKGQRIEGVNSAPVRVGFYQSRWGGPFDTEKEFNDFLARDAPQRPTDNHAIHFAHGDLSPRNIMVDENGNITAILDWEWAGWFPEYWDVTRMFLDLPEKRKMPDYATYLRSVLPDKYEQEYSAMLHVIRLDTPGPGIGIPVHQVTVSN